MSFTKRDMRLRDAAVTVLLVGLMFECISALVYKVGIDR